MDGLLIMVSGGVYLVKRKNLYTIVGSD